MALKYPAVPDPSLDPDSLRLSLQALKQGFEILSQQRGKRLDGAITWQDLVDLELIDAADVPHDPAR
jgi:hypothetical protein